MAQTVDRVQPAKTSVVTASAAGADTTSPGMRRTRPQQGEANRVLLFLNALAFVVGFGAVFTFFGSAAGLLGQRLDMYLPTIGRFGAVLLVLFGLSTLGVFRWASSEIRQRTDVDRNPAAAFLVRLFEFFNAMIYTEKRMVGMHQVSNRWGLASSALLGVSFSAGWVPCIGPILAGIFVLAGNSDTVGQGALLLATYSLGLGIPFLLVALAFSRATQFLRRLNRHVGIVSIISGFFLFYVAYLLWFDRLGALTNSFNFLNNWVLTLEDSMVAFTGLGYNIIGMGVSTGLPLAFLAGLISFLSPCVLPLVPAYIGFLSSASVVGEST